MMDLRPPFWLLSPSSCCEEAEGPSLERLPPCRDSVDGILTVEEDLPSVVIDVDDEAAGLRNTNEKILLRTGIIIE